MFAFNKRKSKPCVDGVRDLLNDYNNSTKILDSSCDYEFTDMKDRPTFLKFSRFQHGIVE